MTAEVRAGASLAGVFGLRHHHGRRAAADTQRRGCQRERRQCGYEHRDLHRDAVRRGRGRRERELRGLVIRYRPAERKRRPVRSRPGTDFVRDWRRHGDWAVLRAPRQLRRSNRVVPARCAATTATSTVSSFYAAHHTFLYIHVPIISIASGPACVQRPSPAHYGG